MSIKQITLAALVPLAFVGGIITADHTSYNPHTLGVWVGDYGIELIDANLVHCADTVGLFEGVDC